MLLDSVGANGTHHHYVYIRCNMFQCNKFDYEIGVFFKKIYFPHTL